MAAQNRTGIASGVLGAVALGGLRYPLLLFLGYLLCAQVGNWLLAKPYGFTVFWLPSGLFVGALLLTPTRRWPVMVALGGEEKSAREFSPTGHE